MTFKELEAYKEKALVAAEQETQPQIEKIKTEIQIAFLAGVSWALKELAQ